VYATTASALVGAIVLNRVWESTYGTEATQRGPLAYDWADKSNEAFSQFWRLAREWVGSFGFLDTAIPVWAFLAWGSIGVALLVAAVAVGRARERLTLMAALVAGASAAILMSATLKAGELGGDVQARHLLPFLVLIPLLAGEIVARHHDRLRRVRVAVPAIFVLAAVLQVVAWYWNARRHAVGSDGPLLFFSEAEWAPPLGWALWLAVAIVGASMIAAVASAVAAPTGSERVLTTPRRRTSARLR
jgi:hypothetical protein